MKTAFATLFALTATLTSADVSNAQCSTIRPSGDCYAPRVIRVVERVTTNRFGARSHLDELADTLQLQANDIAWEMYRRFQHNPGFQETYTEMHQLLQDAKHIHDLVHAHAYRRFHDVDHIAADLHEIDSLFHHIEDDIVRWQPSYVSHHHRRVHGDLFTKMEQMEETLHHLMEDCGVNSTVNAGAPPAPSAGIAPPPRF